MRHRVIDAHVTLESGGGVTARHFAAAGDAPEAVIVLAHGAGAPQTHPFMVAFATGLSGRGLDVVTFNFPYSEARRRVPDRADVLETCFLAVVRHVRDSASFRHRPLFLGGKSMGGRMASHLAAHHAAALGPIGGLVFLGYPLHPPGRPAQRRDAHLPLIGAPMLFVQGERDPFGTPHEMESLVESLGTRARLLLVPGGDHSLAVPRQTPHPREHVYASIQDAIAAWVTEAIGPRPAP